MGDRLVGVRPRPQGPTTRRGMAVGVNDRSPRTRRRWRDAASIDMRSTTTWPPPEPGAARRRPARRTGLEAARRGARRPAGQRRRRRDPRGARTSEGRRVPVVNVYDKGGERYPKINDTLDFLAFCHKPHYTLVEVPAVPAAHRAGPRPASAVIDTDQPAPIRADDPRPRQRRDRPRSSPSAR